MYLALKHLHVTAAVLSFALFSLRGLWMLADSPLLTQRWVKIVPHIVDSVLLAAAIGMLVTIGLNPLTVPWLIAKIVALFAYIGLGTFALKRGRSKAVRTVCWLAALAVFGYIVLVARSKLVWPFA
ncbi:MAG TPA: SirB2 family protein [Candidatus Competibacteraceae bacterium]|nr:SirB2 family protein [Candidatus Competibacteraceae bacterium]